MRTKDFFSTFILRLFLSGIFSLVFIFRLSADEMLLAPHPVIIHSSFEEASKLTPLPDHQFSPLAPHTVKEPFLPIFRVDDLPLPEGMPQNIQLSWLSRFSPVLASLFYGSEGYLQAAIVKTRLGKLDEAIELIEKINPSKVPVYEYSRLLSAWIACRKSELSDCLAQSEKMTFSRDPAIKMEAFYLAILANTRLKDFDGNVPLFDELERTRLPVLWGFRLSFLYLVNLIELRQWETAREFLEGFNQTGFVQAPLYPYVLDLNALVLYEQAQYPRSLELYLQADRIDYRYPEKEKRLRKIAWLYYLNKDYRSALAILRDSHIHPDNPYYEEILYLKALIHIQNKDWNKIAPIIETLKDDSRFGIYIRFQVRSHLAEIKSIPGLYGKVVNIRGDLPRTPFYLNMISGNQFFENKLYSKSKEVYQQILDDKVANQLNWMVQYNLGLTHLKLEEYSLAAIIFKRILQIGPNEREQLIRYHLLYTAYQSGEQSLAYETAKLIKPEQFPPEIQNEILFMLGYLSLAKQDYSEAFDLFSKRFSHTGAVSDFIRVLTALYRGGNYQSILDQIKANPALLSDEAYEFQIKSLLGLERQRDALKSIQERAFEGGQLIELRLEVWLANQQFELLTEQVKPLLLKTADPNKRLLYYLSLGDAYFSLKQYALAKNQFFKALGLTDDSSKKSLILYNIALSTLNYGDSDAFEDEVRAFLLKDELSEEARYNLTQLLVDHRYQRQQTALADDLLRDYIAGNGYRRSQAYLKRIGLLFSYGLERKCYEVAQNPPGPENEFQRSDRLIGLARCGLKIGEAREVNSVLREHLSRAQPYRQDELRYNLARGLNQLEEFEESNLELRGVNTDLAPLPVKMEALLLEAKNFHGLGKSVEAAERLNELSLYPDSKVYLESLSLLFDIQTEQRDTASSLRTLLRIYYHPKTTHKKRQEILLRLARHHLENRQKSQARAFIAKLEVEMRSGTFPAIKEEYLLLKKEVGP
ncbi:MAG: hypothetical protein OEY59_03935 [Deltaproteobacteria bacterium]|nr:hypothetical protein [Deltaproteobacteria bacterium]